jgi:pyrroline-5-carboxylate reductase
MSGYKKFAIVGAGTLGNYIIRQFLKEKAAGTVKEVVVLTRQVSSVTTNEIQSSLTTLLRVGL